VKGNVAQWVKHQKSGNITAMFNHNCYFHASALKYPPLKIYERDDFGHVHKTLLTTTVGSKRCFLISVHVYVIAMYFPAYQEETRTLPCLQ